jgi:hypothetical protein
MSHFYDRLGESRYTLIGKNGKERDTNIKDARELNLLPSVTGIIGQLDKPMLTRWKMTKLLEAVKKINDLKHDPKIYEVLVWEAYKTDTESYSIEGTRVHDALEKFFKTGEMDIQNEEMLWPAVEAVRSIGEGRPEAEPSFASELGYGGKIDLVLHFKDKTVIIDFKTKQGEVSKKNVYDDYIMQLAAYREAIDKKAECYNLFISVTNPGEVYLHQYTEEELEAGMKKFLLLLDLWKLQNKYDPSFKKENI